MMEKVATGGCFVKLNEEARQRSPAIDLEAERFYGRLGRLYRTWGKARKPHQHDR